MNRKSFFVAVTLLVLLALLLSAGSLARPT